MKSFLPYILILLFIFIPSDNASAKNHPSSSTITIGFQHESGFISVGTGTYVKTKIGNGILTAKHVASVFKSMEISHLLFAMIFTPMTSTENFRPKISL